MGNRQLLSGFFIVCLLFGVAFAMGYIVGRNSSPSARALAEMQAPAQAPVFSDARPTASGAVVPPPSANPADAAKPPDAQPAAENPPQTAPEQPLTQPSPGTAPEKPAEPVPAVAPPDVVAGAYWQVMAVKQQEAEVVARTLKDKGFPASLSPGPNNLTRVLVGPYGDRDALGKAKADLENAGFHPILKR